MEDELEYEDYLEDESTVSGCLVGDDEDDQGNKRTKNVNHNKKGKKGAAAAEAATCQVEACTAEMSLAKLYYRRHKVCEVHARATVVPVAGLQQRFCQQCSR